MSLNLTQISNFFNVLSQELTSLNNYHFGFRSDVNRNVNNNFDIGQSTGKLYPASHFAVPVKVSLLDYRNDITAYSCRVFFDTLQGYNNDASTNTDSLLEQLTELIYIAKLFILNVDNIGQEYLSGQMYIKEFADNTPLDFFLDRFAANQHRDRLASVYVDFTLVLQGECSAIADINPTNRADWPLLKDDYEKRGIFAVTGWDTDDDGTIDEDAEAENLGGGVFRSYQFLKNSKNDSLLDGTVTITVTSEYLYNGLPDTVIAVFSGDIGALLTLAANWITDVNIQDYISIGQTAGDGQPLSFDKVLFAQTEGFTNVNAQRLIFDIKYNKAEIVTGNTNTQLSMPTQEITGLYNSISDFVIFNGRYYTAEGISIVGAISENFLDRFYNLRTYATDNNIQSVTRVRIGEANPLGNLYFVTGTSIYYAAAISENSNGGIDYAAPVLLPGNYTSTLLPFETLEEVENGQNLVFRLQRFFAAAQVIAWDGAAYVATDLTGGVFTPAGETIANGIGSMHRIGNTIFLASYSNAAGSYSGVLALKYTNDPRTVENWTRLNIADNDSGTPANGTGATGSIAGFREGIFADIEDLSFGYPTIYLCNRINHVLHRIRATQANPTEPAHFSLEIIAGAVGVPGFTSGIGTAARLTSPVQVGKNPVTGNIKIAFGTGGNCFAEINPVTLYCEVIKGTPGVAGFTLFQEA